MLINYDSTPKRSLIYTSSIVLKILKHHKKIKLESLYKECSKQGLDYSIITYSIDWLFLIGYIQEINPSEEVILK